MPRILRKSSVFALLLVVVLLSVALLFETRSGAANARQTPTSPSARAANASSVSKSTIPRQVGDDDVWVVITNYQDGRIVSRVAVKAGLSSSDKTDDASLSAAAPAQPAAAGDIVFSQLYSGGGNPGSTFQNNYMELFNRTSNTVNISGWRFYLANATGPFNQSISFASSQGINIPSAHNLLIQLGPVSPNGAPVPNPDIIVPGDTIIIPGLPPITPPNLSPSGKVFMTSADTDLIGSTCPLPNSQIVDFVGYGSTANCSEGAGPAPTITSFTADFRKGTGCTDTDNNAADFLTGPPNPRNRFSVANNCTSNMIDNAEFFVRQHYADFLNRTPDASGLAFWVNQITSCGGDQTCIELKRINVSAAFFLSTEFEQTGYLAYRTYKAAYDNIPGAPVPLTFAEFMPDTKSLSQNVVVNQPGWEAQLESNKAAYFLVFVSRLRFRNDYPTTMTPAEFVDRLFLRAGVTPTAAERTAAINEFGAAADTFDGNARARALRRVAENPTLANQEKNRAFVLMQYYGYLRRNPYDPPELTLDFQGYNFWLNKLIQFNGNFVDAEMVKAFITSGEYRQRF
jgi:hypothetical protein